MKFPGNIHSHTEFSNASLGFKDSINKLTDIMWYAAEIGHNFFSLTDHECTSGWIKAEKEIKKIKEKYPDFKLIRGNEIYLCRNDLTQESIQQGERYPHFILLAKDEIGAKQLYELSTRAWMRSFTSRGIKRTPTLYFDLEEVIAVNPGHVIGSTACFLKGQKIKTKKGYKNIEDINSNDYVYNYKGEWEKVIEPTSRNYAGKGYQILFQGNYDTINCTANHQILVSSANYSKNSKTKKSKLYWLPAEELNIQKGSNKNFGVRPINKIFTQQYEIKKEEYLYSYFPKSIYSVKRSFTPDILKITPEIMRLFGLWLGDGSITIPPQNPSVNFTFNLEEFDTFYDSFVKKAISELGGSWSINKRPELHRVDLQSYSREIIELFAYIFGNVHSQNKKIPNRLKHISPKLDYELLFGYMLADGCAKLKKKDKYTTGEFTTVSISKELSQNYVELWNDLGVPVSVYSSEERIDRNNVHHHKAYYTSLAGLTFGMIDKKNIQYSHQDVINLFNKCIKYYAPKRLVDKNGIEYLKIFIKDKKEIFINEKVYCLNNTTHSYVCENLIVHNCRGSSFGIQLMNYRNMVKAQDPQASQLYQEILNWCEYLRNIFGKENFYLEFQPSEDEEQIYINKETIKISRLLNIPYVISTDAHYKSVDQRSIHAAYLNSQDGERETSKFYATTYLMDTSELEQYFEYLTKEELEYAYKNIESIKNSCSEYSLQKPLKIPNLIWKESKLDNIPLEFYNYIPNIKLFLESNFTGDILLIKHIIEKILSDTRLQNQKIYDEVNEELQIVYDSSKVNKVHWSSYFLNLQNIIDTCWNAGSIVGCGRGSGVGFLLLYLLDITQINPLWETTKVYNWRFLNPERESVLDVDFDISGLKREQILEAFREGYGRDRVANVITFGTEQSKSAILSAARGVGIDNDEAQYIASLVPADRGKIRSLKQCYYGDKEKGFKPVFEFKRLMDSEEYRELWEVAQTIEGLVSRSGIHAGGIIFVDEPFSESCALMKAPDGTVVTQFDLHDAEACSLIKYDALSVEAMDKIQICLELLQKDGIIDNNLSLKEAYEQTIGIYNLEREDSDMWKMVWDHKIISLFQMEKASGIQGINLIRPKSVDELAVLNSVIRLMSDEGETPLEKWSRYRKNIKVWYEEMKKYGLSSEEIQWLSTHPSITNGICESQEGLMALVREPRLGGNSLNFADKCRKGLAKKIGSLFDECEQTYYANAKEKNCSPKLVHYVWDVLLNVQRGYSFNRSHTLAYSLVGLQEMNLAYKYPIIYWNCANLIVNAGGEDKGGQTDYNKMARALGETMKAGIKVGLVDINESTYGFKPDTKNNQILYGMKAMLNVGDDIIEETIKNRPYVSIKDYLYRIKPKRQAMISLIKGGAFDNMMERKTAMAWYIWETCDKKKRITLQNMPGLIKYKLIPEENEEQIIGRRIYEFNRYLKAICKHKNDSLNYYLDERAIDFLTEIGKDELINESYQIKVKDWDKIYQSWMDVFRNWIAENKDKILQNLNEKIFMEDWNKYALGSVSAWEMESLCFYYHEHELKNVNAGKYGIMDFYKLPSQPIVDRSFIKGGKTINMYKLQKICGTCIAKDKAKATVSLLTTSGVVNVKFRKSYFALFDKQISEIQPDGKKKRIESSWFSRGEMIMVQGIRSDDNFIPKKYASQGANVHQLYKITELKSNGDLVLTSDRAGGKSTDE